MPILVRVGTRVTGCDRRLIQADERSVLDELDPGPEAFVRRADDLFLELLPDIVVGEVRTYDRNAPGVWQIDHAHSVARPRHSSGHDKATLFAA